jgi:hypothetical protein
MTESYGKSGSWRVEVELDPASFPIERLTAEQLLHEFLFYCPDCLQTSGDAYNWLIHPAGCSHPPLQLRRRMHDRPIRNPGS